MMRFSARVFLAFIFFAGLAFSQTANPPTPAFETASLKVVRPYQPGSLYMRGGPGTSDPTHVTFPYANLIVLLTRAYGVKIDEIFGPDWIKDNSSRRTMFELTATVPPNTSPEQLNLMLQNLLAERLHLVLHRDVRQFPGYELVVAEGGPKLKEYVPSGNPEAAPVGGLRFDADGFPILGPNGSMATKMPGDGNRWGTIRSTYRMQMARFASILGEVINESNGVEMTLNIPRVTDKTGLSGTYEFTLGFGGLRIVPNFPFGPGVDFVNSIDHTPVDPGDVGPGISDALEKQLGLKLVKTKSVPVDVLVIDHVDQTPAEN